MAFVRGFARVQVNGRKGWCAPVELGVAAPHYVSFVVPVDENYAFFSQYICEVVTAEENGKRRESYKLVQHGTDSFILRLGTLNVWFAVRPSSKEERRAPYVGNLEHEDFRYLFTEIEPQEPELLDQLYDKEGVFVFGCEPCVHYAGAKRLAKTR